MNTIKDIAQAERGGRKYKRKTMKKTYQIETGDFEKEVIASSFEEAIISAFAINPPKNPAMLVRMRMKNTVKGNQEHAKQSKWHYQDIKSVLKLAGYSFR